MKYIKIGYKAIILFFHGTCFLKKYLKLYKGEHNKSSTHFRQTSKFHTEFSARWNDHSRTYVLLKSFKIVLTAFSKSILINSFDYNNTFSVLK